MATGRSPELEVALCEVFGLDPQKTMSIEISLKPRDYTVTVIRLFTDDEQLRRVTELLRGVSWERTTVSDVDVRKEQANASI